MVLFSIGRRSRDGSEQTMEAYKGLKWAVKAACKGSARKDADRTAWQKWAARLSGQLACPIRYKYFLKSNFKG
jgi:hypothetical protein